MTIQLFAQSAVATPKTTLEDFETWLGLLLEAQRDVLWQIGDLALAVERQHPSTFHQAFPEWVSPDLIARCKSVSNAYSPGERNILATWTIHMQNAKNPDRVEIVNAHVEAGHTSDEARKTPVQPAVTEQEPVTEPAPVEPKQEAPFDKSKWLLAIDLNYYAHRMFSQAGVDTAVQVCEWFERLIARMQAANGLTDVVFCFDSVTNHRRALTQGWERPYKERTIKDPELVIQLQRIPELLERKNRACVSIDGMEADDVMASYAKQFPGRVTLMTADKDLRQCLSLKCNILRDMEWETNESTGVLMPVYKWITREWKPPANDPGREKPANISCHMKDGLNYSGAAVKGITPELWPHFQAIAGDSTDDIRGVEGIGGKIAMDLILAHGTVENVIQAAINRTADLTDKKIDAILEFEQFAATMLKLTTMRTDLNVPMITKLC